MTLAINPGHYYDIEFSLKREDDKIVVAVRNNSRTINKKETFDGLLAASSFLKKEIDDAELRMLDDWKNWKTFDKKKDE